MFGEALHKGAVCADKAEGKDAYFSESVEFFHHFQDFVCIHHILAIFGGGAIGEEVDGIDFLIFEGFFEGFIGPGKAVGG